MRPAKNHSLNSLINEELINEELIKNRLLKKIPKKRKVLRNERRLGRRFEAEIDRFDSLLVLPDGEGGEFDRHAELHVVWGSFDIHNVSPHTRATTVDDCRDERHLDSRSSEGHDGEGPDLALGRNIH